MKLLDDEEIDRVLRAARRIAVLGIKPQSRRERSAHDIPAYLARVGYAIVPIPVYYPEVTEILSAPVYRSLCDVPGPIDILSVFRRPGHVAAHLGDILAVRPRVVWFQSGLLHLPTGEALTAVGLAVVHDCIGCRRAAIRPCLAPLEGQRHR